MQKKEERKQKLLGSINFLTVIEVRFDRWRALLQAARARGGLVSRQNPSKDRNHDALSCAFQELRR
jgi:hypothetical protein